MKKEERREVNMDSNEFADWLMIVRHFFPNLCDWLNNMQDPRKKHITYSEAVLIFMCIMKNVGGIVTMCSMNEEFARNEALMNLARLVGEEVGEMPDWQTANNYLNNLSPDELDKVRVMMIDRLIQTKQFYGSQLLKCWRIILDGSGISYFRERHCEHCLTRRIPDPKTGKEILSYYHKVLEAKIVLAPNLILSIGTEFIENEAPDVPKQDCELRAAQRLLTRIRKQFPRLPIVVQGDSLYAAMSMMAYCKSLKMHYLFTVKDGSQQTLIKDFRDMMAMDDFKDAYSIKYRDENGTGCFVCSVEKLSGKPQICNFFEYTYTDVNGKVLRFTWVTDLPITKGNLAALIAAGRGRWAIENQGFNNQKKGIYQVEHLCSKNPTGMKNHYLITQIADILMQLYLAFDKKVFKLKKTIKGAARNITESFKRCIITDEQYAFCTRRTTIRLNIPI